MNDTNVTIKAGRLVRDAELKYTTSGLAIVNFCIAVNKSVKQDEGYVDRALFIECKAFGKTGEGVSKYMTKGTQVVITGSDDYEEWEKDGVKHKKHVIAVNQIQLVGSRREEGQGSTKSASYGDVPFGSPAKQATGQHAIIPGASATSKVANTDDFTDDIPF